MICRVDILARLDEMGGHLYELRRLVGDSLVEESGDDVVAAAEAAVVADERETPGDVGAGVVPAPLSGAHGGETLVRNRRG